MRPKAWPEDARTLMFGEVRDKFGQQKTIDTERSFTEMLRPLFTYQETKDERDKKKRYLLCGTRFRRRERAGRASPRLDPAKRYGKQAQPDDDRGGDHEQSAQDKSSDAYKAIQENYERKGFSIVGATIVQGDDIGMVFCCLTAKTSGFEK